MNDYSAGLGQGCLSVSMYIFACLISDLRFNDGGTVQYGLICDAGYRY